MDGYVVRPAVAVFGKLKKKNYANVFINRTFRAKMKLFKDDFIDID